MKSIPELLTANGLGHISAQIEAAALPSIYLHSGEPTESPCSRLGGRPNLPPEVLWPIWNGISLPFIGQLNLAAIPPVEGLPLPAQGSLFFFYAGIDHAAGLDPE